MNLWKTPTGAERKNNPLGFREQAILEKFSHFELKGYYDAGNVYRSFFVPLWEVVGNKNSFEYYMNGGQIHIVG
jgi:hypothetical protein